MSAATPHYADETVTLYCGDMREIVPTLDIQADCVIADPPYQETALRWDRWPDGWPQVIADAGIRSMWCFGSMRMFLDRRDEFAAWKLSQDIVWEKHNGSGFHADRFKRVHEHVTHWYRGDWATVHHEVPTTADAVARTVRTAARPPQMGERKRATYTAERGGPRLMRSVIAVRSMHGSAIHETQKPVGIVAPPLDYACPPGGLVLDPFAGSGTTAVAARLSGRRTVLIEGSEAKCEEIVTRLAQDVLPIAGGPGQ